jgi:integrase
MQKWIEPEHVSHVLGQAKTLRDKALLAVVYQLGLRRSEVRRILRSDYDGSHVEFTRSKAPFRIKVKLWPRTKTLLDAYLATRHGPAAPAPWVAARRCHSKDWLFMTRVKKAMSGQMVYLIYRDAARAVGLSHVHCNPHTLRHSIAAHLARAGLDIVEIKNFMGHTSSADMAGARNPIYDMDLAGSSHHVAAW